MNNIQTGPVTSVRSRPLCPNSVIRHGQAMTTVWTMLLSLANETKRLYSFVRKFLTKRWLCNGDTNETQ
jgi:hypothetical protein